MSAVQIFPPKKNSDGGEKLSMLSSVPSWKQGDGHFALSRFAEVPRTVKLWLKMGGAVI